MIFGPLEEASFASISVLSRFEGAGAGLGDLAFGQLLSKVQVRVCPKLTLRRSNVAQAGASSLGKQRKSALQRELARRYVTP